MPVDSPYDALVMDHIRNARNFRLPGDATRHSHGVNPLCGDEVTIYVRASGTRVEEAAFQCSCCGISMASASMATVSVAGLDLAAAITRARAVISAIRTRTAPDATRSDEMVNALLATVRDYPARGGCAALPWITLEAALEGRAGALLDP